MAEGKICKKCNVWKPLDGFLKHPNCKTDGHKGTCRDCEKLYRKEYAKRNKEKLAIRQKEKYERIKGTPEYKEKVKAYQEKTKDIKREYDKKYREENAERLKEIKRRYSEDNKERIAQYRKRWRANNKERIENYRKENKEVMTEYNKRYWIENKDKQKAALSVWRKENAERIRRYRVENRDRDRKKAQEWHASERGSKLRTITTNRYRAKKRLLERDFSAKDWDACLEYFGYKCAYCGVSGNLEQEHFVPVTKNGPFTRENIVPSCRKCNANKSNRDFGEWYENWEHYSVEREKKVLQYLGKEVPDYDSLQVHGSGDKQDFKDTNDSDGYSRTSI